MASIFLISKNEDLILKLEQFFKEYSYSYLIKQSDNGDFLSEIKSISPDLILIDSGYKNYENYVKLAKSTVAQNYGQVILLIDDKKNSDCFSFVDGFIMQNSDFEIMKGTILSHLKIKKSLDKLGENNTELSKSLYQINALYNTSSQFAGTLNKDELCNIMLEGLERILSFDIASVLIFAPDNGAVLHINSLCELSETLSHALKMRLTLKYNNVFENEKMPFNIDFDKIRVVEKIKPSNSIYDLKILNYNTLFAPIMVGDNFFGVVEIIKKEPFTSEDVTCFQTIVHQVALPLRSATLYEEIKETNIKLEKLEKLKSEFVSIVSHELRTPLTPINNSLEIVLSGSAGEITDDIKNFINMAKRNVQRLSGIIEDLLDLSRVQTGKLEYKFKKVELKQSIELLYQTFLASAQDKGINFETDVQDDLGEFYLDCHRFEQIISNIISNALKFTSKGGLIKLTTEKDVEPAGDFIEPVEIQNSKYLKISVEDNGVGMKKEDIPKIFDKFSQIESSLNRNIGGVGLGLAITKQLLDTHFGLISVESEKDVGSKFNIFLPNFNEETAFKIDVNYAILRSLNFAIFHIRQNKDVDFVSHLFEENILKKTQKSTKLTIVGEKYEHHYIFMPYVEGSAVSFMKQVIEDKMKQDEWQNCGILLECATNKDIDEVKNIIREMKG